MVDLRGLEPLTPCMPCRCATSCATGPWSPFAATTPAYYIPLEGKNRRQSVAAAEGS